VATTEYILTDADVGRAFPEIDGYLLSLVRSRSSNHRGSTSPNWNETHFILRDSQSTQNLFCLDHLCSAPLKIGGASFYVINAALQFHGELKLVSCPLGSEWELVLSDVFVPPRMPRSGAQSSGNGMWGQFPSFRTYAERARRSAHKPKPLALPPPALRIGASIAGEAVQIERDA
jgi:hypothetical protein